MKMAEFLWIVVCSFSISCLATFLLSRYNGPLQILDHPNTRSLHSTPIPRTGGLAIWAGALTGGVVAFVLFEPRSEAIWIGTAAALVGVVSHMDDRLNVTIVGRLVTHIVAGSLLLANGLTLRSLSLPGINVHLPSEIGILLSILFVVWMTNLYNFMDGMDGFAAGMTTIGFGTLALLGFLAKEPFFVAVNLAVAAAAGGFLIFNFSPARIFMGDTGSSTIGFLAAAFVLWAAHDNIFPLWVGVMVFSPFVIDATLTVVRRLMRHDRIWLAHKTHYYQRLVQLGWGHKKTTLGEYSLMIACSVSAIIGVHTSATFQWMLIGFWIGCYVGLIVWIHWTENRRMISERGEK